MTSLLDLNYKALRLLDGSEFMKGTFWKFYYLEMSCNFDGVGRGPWCI